MDSDTSLPRSVIWFDQPVPVRWENELYIWTTDGFHEPKFDPETLKFTVRTSRFGIFGTAAKRWTNLPYVNWSLKAVELNSTTFTLKAAKVTLEFTIKVCKIS